MVDFVNLYILIRLIISVIVSFTISFLFNLIVALVGIKLFKIENSRNLLKGMVLKTSFTGFILDFCLICLDIRGLSVYHSWFRTLPGTYIPFGVTVVLMFFISYFIFLRKMIKKQRIIFSLSFSLAYVLYVYVFVLLLLNVLLRFWIS